MLLTLRKASFTGSLPLLSRMREFQKEMEGNNTSFTKYIHPERNPNIPLVCDSSLMFNRKRKCYALYLGCAKIDKDECCTRLRPAACSRLRCMKCNHLVTRFHGKVWMKIDYLFLRNAHGTDNIYSRLANQNESVAYCCQCSWIDTDNFIQLPKSLAYWRCGGHS